MKQLLFALLFTSSAFIVKAQTADEIIESHINALGGAEKIATIQTVSMVGSINVQGLDVSVIVTASNGKGSRTDIAVPGMGEGFQIYTPTKAWSFMPFQGQTSVEELPEDKQKDGLAQLDVQGLLLNYKEKGSKVELLGKEMYDGDECYKLKVETSYGKSTTYFINSKTYYRVKSISAGPTGADVETVFSNFKKTEQGFVFPFSQSNPNGTLEFSSIEVNKPVDEKIFSPS